MIKSKPDRVPGLGSSRATSTGESPDLLEPTFHIPGGEHNINEQGELRKCKYIDRNKAVMRWRFKGQNPCSYFR